MVTVVEVVEPGTDVVPVRAGLVELAAPLEHLVAAQQAHMATCEALLDKSTDYQAIGGKTFKKKSAWQKLATAYNVSTEVVAEEYLYDEEGHTRRAKFRVRATAPNGRFAEGTGLCDVIERTFGLKQDHDIPATAETRATNRACSNLFGLGEVSAEEAQGGSFDDDDRPARRSSQGRGQQKKAGGDGPTDAQMRFLHKLIDDQGLSDVDQLTDASRVANRKITELAELTVSEASDLIDEWRGDK